MQSTSRETLLEETQAGIKIARRNINNLRYADDTTLMAESEEELKSFLMKLKEESEKVGLKLRKRRSWYLVPSLSALRVVSSAYLRLLRFLLAILIPACVSTSPAFLMMYSAYQLNKQGDNIHTALTYSFSYLEPVNAM